MVSNGLNEALCATIQIQKKKKDPVDCMHRFRTQFKAAQSTESTTSPTFNEAMIVGTVRKRMCYLLRVLS